MQVYSSSTTISAPNLFTISSTISCAPLPISSTVYHAVDVACFTLEKLEGVCGLGLASTVALSQATIQTNLLPDMKCASFLNLALSTLLALTNVLVTFNAHLSLSDTIPIDTPLFLFFIPFCPVSHCLVLYYAIRFTFICLHFVLMKSIWLAFILSRDVFVLTHIKARMVFYRPPPPPTTNSRRRAFAQNFYLSFIVSGSESTFTFPVALNTLPTLAMLVRDLSEQSILDKYIELMNLTF